MVIGHHDGEPFDLERSVQLQAVDRQVLETGQLLEREEHNILKQTGETRTYWSIKAPLRDAHGRIVGLCGISTDITDALATEVKLAGVPPSRGLRHPPPGGSVATPAAGRQRIVRAGRSQHHQGRPRREPCLRMGAPPRRRRPGLPREVVLSAIELEARQVLLATVRDFTERELAEAEIHALNAQLERRVRCKHAAVAMAAAASGVRSAAERKRTVCGTSSASSTGSNSIALSMPDAQGHSI
ncbi:PAS domain-containing protein [Thiohalocapsa marina]|uniref:PAS domain-containing protein n=1 Tax=Thiohalocapsa marina TaxID=424902 RepID=A0A5M8FAL3_9GAMM|nr:PAS domain-containing protein [Thiohalocapsa marina]